MYTKPGAKRIVGAVLLTIATAVCPFLLRYAASTGHDDGIRLPAIFWFYLRKTFNRSVAREREKAELKTRQITPAATW